MARLCFTASTPKEFDRPDLLEDAFDFDEPLTRLAVSDGASESYDSRTWARLLVQRFKSDPGFGSDWLTRTLETYESGVDRLSLSLSWSKQTAFERGSFATLVGVQIHESERQVSVLGIGDSVAVLVEGDAFSCSFPLRTAAEFLARPQLLSTRAGANGFALNADFADRHSTTLSVTDATTLLLLTDAIAAWFLASIEDCSDRWRSVLSLSSAQELEALVREERANGRMRVDDVTVLRVQFAP